jgi:hypothetical protein
LNGAQRLNEPKGLNGAWFDLAHGSTFAHHPEPLSKDPPERLVEGKCIERERDEVRDRPSSFSAFWPPSFS